MRESKEGIPGWGYNVSEGVDAKTFGGVRE